MSPARWLISLKSHAKSKSCTLWWALLHPLTSLSLSFYRQVHRTGGWGPCCAMWWRGRSALSYTSAWETTYSTSEKECSSHQIGGLHPPILSTGIGLFCLCLDLSLLQGVNVHVYVQWNSDAESKTNNKAHFVCSQACLKCPVSCLFLLFLTINLVWHVK